MKKYLLILFVLFSVPSIADEWWWPDYENCSGKTFFSTGLGCATSGELANAIANCANNHDGFLSVRDGGQADFCERNGRRYLAWSCKELCEIPDEPPPPPSCPSNGIAGYYGNGAATCNGSCTIERISDSIVNGTYAFGYTGAPCDEPNTNTSCQFGSRIDGSCFPDSCPFGDCDDPNSDPDPPEENCPAGQSWGGLNGLWACWGESNDCPAGTSGGTLHGQFICYPDPGDPQGCPSGTVPGTINGHNVCYPDDYGGPGDGDGGDNGDGDGNGPPTGGGGGDGGNNGGGGSNGDGNGPPTGGGGGGGGGSNDGDDKGSASGGGDCSSAPTCEGDPILCAQLNQQWLARCAMSESDVKQRTSEVIGDGEGEIDTLFDSLEDGLQDDVDQTKTALGELADNIAGGDAGNFLQAIFPTPSSCQPYTLKILDNTHTMECEHFETFKVAFGYFLAVMTGIYIWSMAIKPVER